jgi:Amt family ammonium transporter
VAVALFAPVSSFSAGFTRWDQLLVQLCGVGVCFLWAFGVCWIGLTVVRKFVSLRVMADEEHVGLNVAEHGAATEFQDLLGAMDAHIQGDMSARVPIDDLTDAGLIAAQYNRVLDSVEAKTEEVHQANIELSAANKEAIAAQKQLTHKMEELEEFNDLAVGRELRMVDLKSEINELLDQQGQAERYQVDDTIEQSEGSVEAISMALASISFADGDIERESEFKEESASVNE